MVNTKLQVDIFHNVLWAKYKGDIFKELLKISNSSNLDIKIFQIAETEISRLSLGPVNRADHQYQYQLLFDGPYEKIGFFKLIPRLVKVLFQSQSRVVVLPGYHLREHWMMLLILKLKSKRTLVFCDSTELDNKKHFIKEFLKKIFFRSVDGVLCYGTASADYVRYYLTTKDYKKVYYPCSSASLPVEHYTLEEIKLQRQHLLQQKTKQFLFVGRLSPEKGILDLLDAWAASDILKSQHQLKIAGEGPQRTDIQQKLKDLGIEHSVHLLGACAKSELNQLYKDSYGMVLPSYSEPWGLVVNEAYYFGCPVIMSENCGCMIDLALEKEIQTFPIKEHIKLKNCITNLIELKDYEELSLRCKLQIEKYTPHSAAIIMINAFLNTFTSINKAP